MSESGASTAAAVSRTVSPRGTRARKRARPEGPATASAGFARLAIGIRSAPDSLGAGPVDLVVTVRSRPVSGGRGTPGYFAPFATSAFQALRNSSRFLGSSQDVISADTGIGLT